MIVELLHKEYRENLSFKKKYSWPKKILKMLGTLIGISVFVAFEVYLFMALDKKLVEFSPFGSLDFLILFLGILLIFSVFTSLNKAKNVFYKKSDSTILLHIPIDKDEVIFSKSLFVYLYSVLINFVISVPLLVSYGATRGIEQNIFPRFYVLSLLYPFFVSIFSTGLVLLFLPLYNKIFNFLKNKAFVQIALGSCLVVTLCFGYQYVLNLFLNLISNSKFDSLFSKDFLNSLHTVGPLLFPVSGFVNMTHVKKNLIGNISISFGISIVMVTIGFITTSLSYTKFLKNEFSQNKSIKHKNKGKIDSSFRALLKKEFVLIFRNSNYVFSYTSLLIMQPFLAYVVISSLNSLLYENMEMFLVYFPELINGMNILLLLLFSSIISSSSLDAFSRENKEVMIVKYIPIDPVKQSLVKIIIPIIFSIGSFVLTSVVLISFGAITPLCFLVSILLGIILQFVLNFCGIYVDLAKMNESQKNDISFLGSVVSVILPIIIFGIHLLMSFYGLNTAAIYSTEIILMLIILCITIIPFKKIVNNFFIKMRVN